MVYLSHYEEYPIYEPAEGGYYYEGVELVKSERMSLRKAKREIKKLFLELKEDPYEEKWFKCLNYRERSMKLNPGMMLVRHGEHIGEGSMICIERKMGEHERGWEPYC